LIVGVFTNVREQKREETNMLTGALLGAEARFGELFQGLGALQGLAKNLELSKRTIWRVFSMVLGSKQSSPPKKGT